MRKETEKSWLAKYWIAWTVFFALILGFRATRSDSGSGEGRRCPWH